MNIRPQASPEFKNQTLILSLIIRDAENIDRKSGGFKR